MARVFNFGAGPATLPEPVLRQAAEEMLDWRGTGMSVMEMSHRGKVYMEIYARVEADPGKEYPLTPQAGAYVICVKGYTGPNAHTLANKLALYLRQQGLWTREVTGFDPGADRARLDPYCPVRNVTPDYPPILMVHGTRDDDVPYDRSVEMAKELARQGVPHDLVTVHGAGHGLGGGDPQAIEEAHEKALAFIRKHLR